MRFTLDSIQEYLSKNAPEIKFVKEIEDINPEDFKFKEAAY